MAPTHAVLPLGLCCCVGPAFLLYLAGFSLSVRTELAHYLLSVPSYGCSMLRLSLLYLWASGLLLPVRFQTVVHFSVRQKHHVTFQVLVHSGFASLMEPLRASQDSSGPSLLPYFPLVYFLRSSDAHEARRKQTAQLPNSALFILEAELCLQVFLHPPSPHPTPLLTHLPIPPSTGPSRG